MVRKRERNLLANYCSIIYNIIRSLFMQHFKAWGLIYIVYFFVIILCFSNELTWADPLLSRKVLHNCTRSFDRTMIQGNHCYIPLLIKESLIRLQRSRPLNKPFNGHAHLHLNGKRTRLGMVSRFHWFRVSTEFIVFQIIFILVPCQRRICLLGFRDPNTWTAWNVFGNEAPRLGPGPQARVGPCRVCSGAELVESQHGVRFVTGVVEV